MGQFVMLRRTNVAKVAEITGWTAEELEFLLERAELKGQDRVKLPLVPRSMREAAES